jgi:Lrp/AsnC family leucine-responsive transcriptional regulator
VIAGYRAIINAESVGLGMTAIIRVRTTHDKIQSCLQLFADMPEVIEVNRLTGEDCFHLKVIVPTPGQLERIVDGVARFGSVITCLVLRSEPVKPISRKLLNSVG